MLINTENIKEKFSILNQEFDIKIMIVEAIKAVIREVKGKDMKRYGNSIESNVNSDNNYQYSNKSIAS